MIYVMSDLHGCYEEYIKMLKLINFSDDDTLYVLGDICDRGKRPMSILLHMMDHENIIPIYGNHDLNAYYALERIGYYSEEVLKDRDYVLTHYLMDKDEYGSYLYWLIDGGKTTLVDYNKLTKANKDKIVRYLSDFKYYDEINVRGKKYVLVHSGFKCFDKNKELYEYRVTDLVYQRLDYDKIYYDDKIIISGHTPTKYIDDKYVGKIIKKNNHIAIDCGCVFGYGLGCICLDTMKEYYVKMEKNNGNKI